MLSNRNDPYYECIGADLCGSLNVHEIEEKKRAEMEGSERSGAIADENPREISLI